jgi:hypothetical protein
MSDSRADMLPEGPGTAERNEKLAGSQKGAVRRALLTQQPWGRQLLRRLHLSSIVRRHERWIRIPRYQTAELWMVPDLKDRKPAPMVYTCPICSEKEETRLLSVVLENAPTRLRRRLRSSSKRTERPRILLRITREQLEDIRADFESTPPKPRRFRSDPDIRTDREIVFDSLVP